MMNSERLEHAELLLTAYHQGLAYGRSLKGQEAALAKAVKWLNLESVMPTVDDFFESFRDWLTNRLVFILKERDPRFRKDCKEVRNIAFFSYYYLGPPITHDKICQLPPSASTLLPNVTVLLRWWESKTCMLISSRPPVLPSNNQEKCLINDLLPVTDRAVGYGIQAAKRIIFNAPPKPYQKRLDVQVDPRDPVMSGRSTATESYAHARDRMRLACWVQVHQWPTPKTVVIPTEDVVHLVEMRRCLLVGDYGSGRSTLLQQIARMICKREQGGAVVVDLRNSELWSLLAKPAALASKVLSIDELFCDAMLRSG